MMVAEIEPGPTSSGKAIGTTPMASRSLASASSSGVARFSGAVSFVQALLYFLREAAVNLVLDGDD